MDVNTFLGLAAALFTTMSNLPQALKVWRTGETGDLSFKMLLTLATGLCLWIGYGILQSDLPIIIANTVSACLVAFILAFKVRDMMR